MLETQGHRDQVAALGDAMNVLASRHGDRFRQLENDIRTTVARLTPDDVDLHNLGDGRCLAEVPKFSALLKRARTLGVI